MVHKYMKLLLLPLVFCAAFVMFGAKASAATLAVNSTADTAVQDDGDCTLREAINNINSGSDTTDGGGGGDCVAGDGNNDTITLPAGTIVLGSNLPTVTVAVTIHGDSMTNTVIDGAGSWHALDAAATSADTFTVTDLTVIGYVDRGIQTSGLNVVLQRIEIDGTGATETGGGVNGLLLNMISVDSLNLSVEDVYLHDIYSVNGSIGINVLSDNSTSTIQRLTAARVGGDSSPQSYGLLFVVGFANGFQPTSVNATVENVTVQDVISVGNSAGIGVSGGVSGGTTNVNAVLNNVTVNHIRGQVGGGFGQAGILAGGAAATQSDVINLNLDVTNAVLSDAESSSCAALDVTALLNGLGTANPTITSFGGNLSDDNSCAAFFTQPTDQNNVAGLAASLLPLANNGGYVPTMALAQGSPAVDAGVTVTGLSNDARLAGRPQGAAFDSGAYESPYSKQVAQVPTLAASGWHGLAVVLVGAVFAPLIAYSYFGRQKSYQL